MTTIYLKSRDERTVISLRGKRGRIPQVPEFLAEHGYTQVDPQEFRRIKARIQRQTMRHEITAETNTN